MVVATSTTKPFIPGTSGWTAADLAASHVQREWSRGRYEIVEGVLSIMPPAYLPHGASLFALLSIIRSYLKEHKITATLATEVDLVLSPQRVVVADAVMMTPQDQKHQASAIRGLSKSKHGQARIVVPPTLVIESISPDDPDHDRKTKRRWYAEFQVPNYWMLDSYEKTLECLTLRESSYRMAASGKKSDRITPSLFDGIEIPLEELWD